MVGKYIAELKNSVWHKKFTAMEEGNYNMLADQQSVGGTIASAGAMSGILLFFQNSLQKLVPLMVIAAAVIVLDLIYGWKAAKKRGTEPVTISRALRRTIGKAVEYFCWCVLASTLGVALKMPTLENIIVIVVIGIECISIFQNWYYVHYKKAINIDVAKIGEEVIKDKTGIDVGDAIQKENESKDNENTDR